MVHLFSKKAGLHACTTTPFGSKTQALTLKGQNLIPFREAVSGHFDRQIQNSIISHDHTQ